MDPGMLFYPVEYLYKSVTCKAVPFSCLKQWHIIGIAHGPSVSQ